METCDLLIIGAGPAGLAAAINAASEGLTTYVLDRSHDVGGQARKSSKIENYLGFPAGCTGADLTEAARVQAERFGAAFIQGAEVIDLRCDDGRPVAMCASGTVYECRAAIVATGVTYRRLEAPGVERLLGRGVEYGMSPTDLLDLQGQRVHVVGGANSAGQAVLHLARRAQEVVLVTRSPLEKSMSQYLIDRIYAAGNIRVAPNTRIAAVDGDEHLDKVTLASPSGVWTETSAGLFAFIGAVPHTEWVGAQKDAQGFILSGIDLSQPRKRQQLEASIPGVFVAGDVRSGSIKRVAAAAGEGAMAVANVHRFLGG